MKEQTAPVDGRTSAGLAALLVWLSLSLAGGLQATAPAGTGEVGNGPGAGPRLPAGGLRGLSIKPDSLFDACLEGLPHWRELPCCVVQSCCCNGMASGRVVTGVEGRSSIQGRSGARFLSGLNRAARGIAGVLGSVLVAGLATLAVSGR